MSSSSNRLKPALLLRVRLQSSALEVSVFPERLSPVKSKSAELLLGFESAENTSKFRRSLDEVLDPGSTHLDVGLWGYRLL